MAARGGPLRRVVAWGGAGRHVLECGHQLGRRFFSGLPNMLEAERVARARCVACARGEAPHVPLDQVRRLTEECRRHQAGAWMPRRPAPADPRQGALSLV